MSEPPPADQTLTRRPSVVSFYSYKGGVGRTLLAANVAVGLAARGKTLIWDLDVEAPGLQYIPALKPGSPVKLGFIEWLRDWQSERAASGSEAPSEKVGISQLQGRKFTDGLRATSVKQLYCLPALSDEIDPARVYQDIDWSWFEREPAQALSLLELLLQRLSSEGFVQVVVDSRTGYTDLGALLVGLLADVSVLVGGYGEQNLRGLARIWRALKSDRPELAALRSGRLPPWIELVASPIPHSNVDLAAAGRQKWAEAFGLERAGVHEIPFDPELPFTEKLLIVADPERPAAQGYQQVAQAVANHFDWLDAKIDSAFGDRRHASLGDKVRLPARMSETRRVRRLLELLDYQTEATNEHGDGDLDFLARVKVGLEEVHYLVEIKSALGPAVSRSIEPLSRRVDALRRRFPQLRGMLVTGQRFTQKVKEAALESDVRLLSVEDLEAQLIDRLPYLRNVIREHDSNAADHLYEPTSEPISASAGLRQSFIADSLLWAKGETPPLWAVFGEPGTGKTTLLHRMCREIASKALDDSTMPVPVLIRLREARRTTVVVSELLADRWMEVTGERKSAAVFDHLLNAGRVVALLDGLDELSHGVSGGKISEVWERLLGPAGERSSMKGRIVVASRPVVVDLEGIRFTRLQPMRSKEVYALMRRQARGSGSSGIQDQLRRDLAGFSKDSPLLFDAIARAMPVIGQSDRSVDLQLESPGRLYLAMIQSWTEAVTRAEGGAIGLTSLIEEIAWQLWAKDLAFMDVSEVVDLAARSRESADGPAIVERDLLAMPFIERTGSGVGFSHRTLQEFCLALALLRRLADAGEQRRAISDLSLPRLSEQVVQFVFELTDGEGARREALVRSLRWVLAERHWDIPGASLAKANALMLAHGFAVRDAGGGHLHAVIRTLCPRYIPDGAKLEGVSLARMPLTGVVLRAASLSGANLEETNLSGADFRGAQLDGATLARSRVFEVHFGKASLRQVDFCGAIVQRVNFDGATASGSAWNGAKVAEITVHGAAFHGADLRRAKLDRKSIAAVIEHAGGALLSSRQRRAGLSE